MSARLTIKQLNSWWGLTDFREMEKITRYRQFDFDPEDGYRAFVDACDGWWEQLPLSTKKELYKEYN